MLSSHRDMAHLARFVSRSWHSFTFYERFHVLRLLSSRSYEKFVYLEASAPSIDARKSHASKNHYPSAHPSQHDRLSLASESVREAPHVVLEWAPVLEELDVGTISLEATLATLGHVVLTGERGEAPVLADDLKILLE